MKFKVEVVSKYTTTVEVEASSKDEAYHIVEAMQDCGVFEDVSSAECVEHRIAHIIEPKDK